MRHHEPPEVEHLIRHGGRWWIDVFTDHSMFLA